MKGLGYPRNPIGGRARSAQNLDTVPDPVGVAARWVTEHLRRGGDPEGDPPLVFRIGGGVRPGFLALERFLYLLLAWAMIGAGCRWVQGTPERSTTTSIAGQYQESGVNSTSTSGPWEDNTAMCRAPPCRASVTARRTVSEYAHPDHGTGQSWDTWWEERQHVWGEYFDAEEYPTMARVWGEGEFEKAEESELVDSYDYGLERLLDGIEERARRSSET